MEFITKAKALSKTSAALIALTAVVFGAFVLPSPDPAFATQCWLTVDRSTITKGESAVITWKKHNPGERLTIDNGIGLVGEGKTQGTVTVSPQQTTTYTGTNKNANHTQTCKVTITVVEPKPVCTLTASAHEITKGDAVELAWTSKHTTEATFNPGASVVALNGSANVSPQADTTYTVRFKGKDGSYVSCEKSVKVKDLPPPPPPPPSDPVCTLNASDSGIELGQSVTLTWTSQNAVSGSMSPVPGSIALSGSLTATPDTSTTYVATFVAANGKTVSCETRVQVEDTNPWCEVFANPSTIERGQSAKISWNSDHVSSVTIDNGIGAVGRQDERTVTPAQTTTYTGTFVGTNGKTIECDATVTVTEPQPNPGPTCEMSINPTSVRKDGAATLSWSSANAASATINQGIGPVSPNGSQGVTVSQDTVYTGTFRHSDGREVTCTASVRVEGGGGGGGPCLNCRGDDDDDDDDDDDANPSIVLSRSIDLAEPKFITLTEVPYTGFTAGPVMTAAFWLGVVALAAVIAYAVTYANPFAGSRSYAASAPVPTSTERAPMPQIRESVAYQVPVYAPAPKLFADAATAGAGSLTDTIEEIAQRERILFSPDALRSIAAEASKAPGMLTQYLDAFFAEVKAHFAPEDGWILISRERVNTVAVAMRTNAPAAEPAPAPAVRVEAPAPRPAAAPVAAPTREQVEAPVRAEAPKAQARPAFVSASAAVPARPASPASAAPASVGTFVGFLAGNKPEDAYAMLRDLHAKEGSASAFVGEVVRALDEVYKHRIEGNHSPDAAVAAAVATLSNGQLEKVIGILVESVDYSYSSNRIGTKVAVAKVFEYFEKTKVQA